MKRFVTGAIVWGFVGVVSYFTIANQDSPQVANAAKPTPVGVAVVRPPAPKPSEPAPLPATLPTVVEVADLTPLLDPPVRPVGGVPFDMGVVVPATLVPAPPLIPLADD